MAQKPKKMIPAGTQGRERVLVEDGKTKRPFMRGIMVHSLMARGVSFEEAFRTANEVRARTRDRGVIERDELAKLVFEVLDDESAAEHQPPLPLPASVLVGDEDDSAPFSKGILSQSLLAASIDPSDAFEVAREIEIRLLQDRCERVQRADLRRLSYESLLQRFGDRTASRYLIWRAFQEPKKPVIILLGGSSGVGKTSLALEVARRLGISRVLSTDSIRQVMRIMLSPELMPAIHASSFDAHRHLTTSPGMEEEGVDPVVRGFAAQASIVAVGVRAMLDRAIEENTSLVLDGVSLVPGEIDLDAYKEAAHVIYLVVARLDEESFRNHFMARGKRSKHRNADRYMESLDDILKIQENFLELADHYDIPIVDNVTIEGSVMLVIRHVVETLRESGDVEESELL